MGEAGLLPHKILSELGRFRKRGSHSPRAGSRRWFLLALIMTCTTILTARVLWGFLFLFAGGATSVFNHPHDNHNLQRDASALLQATAGWDVEENETTVFVLAGESGASDGKDETAQVEEKAGTTKSADAFAFLEQLAENLTGTGVEDDDGPYHSRRIFQSDYEEMKRNLRIFVYPHALDDPFYNIFRVRSTVPKGNYASEEYFKQALMNSSFVTKHAAEADFFFLPVSITEARIDRRVGVEGLQNFCEQYVTDVRSQWSYWNRSSGADHFYLSCHSIARSAMDRVPYVRHNAIQLLCPASYFLPSYITHKDASVPQIWPRLGSTPKQAGLIAQRTRLAFFAGSLNSNVRQELAKAWGKDPHILVHSGVVPFPYSDGMLTSKFCLHAKGFEVNTARIGDAMFYGCVPVVIANYYDLPFNDVLDWSKFSLVVATLDIPLLKKTLEQVTPAQYAELHKHVMQARVHFQWHTPPQEYDAFHMVMYELWARRHVVRHSLH